jgi:CBS domain-containing protein
MMQDTLQGILARKGATVHYVIPGTPVIDAVRRMNQERIGALLVCENGEMVGIFTERDVLCRVVDEGRDPKRTKVFEVMTSEVIAVRPDTVVEDAMAIISERRFRHLPVLDEGSLVGLVSAGDLTKWVSRHQEGHIQHLEDFITGKYPG